MSLFNRPMTSAEREAFIATIAEHAIAIGEKALRVAEIGVCPECHSRKWPDRANYGPPDCEHPFHTALAAVIKPD